MKQVDAAVRRETLYIAAWVLVMSVLMQAVFLVIGRWDYTVLLGNLLGGGAAVGNFFLMGLTVQSAVNKEEKDAATAMKASQKWRLLLLLVVGVVGVVLPCFNTWALLIPLFFPRVAVAFRPVFNKT